MNNLVFVCGALRSGTTLIHVMLDQHPRIDNPGEFDFLFDRVSDDGMFPELGVYLEWLSSHRIYQSKNLEADSSLSYPELMQSFVSQKQSDNILALNVHKSFDRIPYLFPDAKFIHVLRDPRDVARSSIGMGWSGNVYYGVDHWIESENSWERLSEKLPPKQCYELRYEQLISSPESTLQSVCEFLDLSYDEKMLDYAERSSYGKPDPSLINQWKNKLTAREIQYVEGKAHKLMTQLGYELSAKPLAKIGFVEKLWLSISNKIFRVKFAVKRYGVCLYFTERLSRKFRLTKINKQARLKINEIAKGYLK
ncbi:MAG: sulfotransferase [Endozoicomonadaceae bacterium]|nr:sulfotransferase [Endozoicomonadaceae bacterium]